LVMAVLRVFIVEFLYFSERKLSVELLLLSFFCVLFLQLNEPEVLDFVCALPF
jgi:hypothetical protein